MAVADILMSTRTTMTLLFIGVYDIILNVGLVRTCPNRHIALSDETL